MDFNDTPEEAEFRAEARAFLEANAEPKAGLGMPSTLEDLSEEEGLARAKTWQKKKSEGRFVGLHWPEKYGGRGLAPMNTVIYQMEEANFDVPRGYFEIGLGMAAPTLMMYATEDQKKRYIPPMSSGEEVWCQLFSEPSAGSDLAGLRLKCELQDDEWVLNGQKVWTSGAHYSDYGIVVARHDPTVPKHRGLTYFFIDMKSPGIEVKRIDQISGASNFCEVFFTDVRVPDSQRLGAVGQGWQVSLTTLMNERLAIGGAVPPDFDELYYLVSNTELEDGPALQNSAVREKMADWFVQMQGLKYTRLRTLTALSKGQTPGPEASIGKIVSANKLQEISAFGMDLLDMGGSITAEGVVPMNGAFPGGFLWAPGIRIAGGTDEILRNIIAERVLGLPGDIRIDKTGPFNELASGSV